MGRFRGVIGSAGVDHISIALQRAMSELRVFHLSLFLIIYPRCCLAHLAYNVHKHDNKTTL